MVNKTFITELDKHLLIYGAILCFGITKTNDEVVIITPRNNKLTFSIQIDTYEKEIKLQLLKVSNQKAASTKYSNLPNKQL